MQARNLGLILSAAFVGGGLLAHLLLSGPGALTATGPALLGVMALAVSVLVSEGTLGHRDTGARIPGLLLRASCLTAILSVAVFMGVFTASTHEIMLDWRDGMAAAWNATRFLLLVGTPVALLLIALVETRVVRSRP